MPAAVTALGLTFAAWAEPAPAPPDPVTPSPARQCADAAAGSEVEVCLQVAVQNPNAVEEVAAALIAHMDRAQTPDRTLLDAVLLLSSDRAVDGARLLGALGDPRAVPVLLAAAERSDPRVATAAVGALSAFPAAIPVLGDWLSDRARPVPLRVAAATTLGEARSNAAAEALSDALRRRQPALVREAIVAALDNYYGITPSTLDLPPSTDGAPWLAAAWGGGLAYAMGSAGHFGRTELWQVAALTGAVTGSGVGWLYARRWPMEAGDAATIAVLGIGGATAGTLVGAGLSPVDAVRPADVPLLVGLGGEAVGFGLGFALTRFDRRATAGDAVEAAALGGILALGAESAAIYARANGEDSRRALSTGIATAAGLGLGEVLAPAFTLRNGAGWVASGAVLGFGCGMLAPIGVNDRTLLPVATTAGGATIGFVLGAVGLPTDAFVGGGTGAAFGAGVGAGAGLLATPDDLDLARGLGLAGTLLGYGVGFGVARADPDPIDDRDVGIAMAADAWAAWDAFAVASALGDGTSTRSIGAVLLAGSVAGGTAAALNLALDIPVPHTLSASAIGLFGGYAGAAIGELVGVSPFALALPMSNAGVLAGAILVSPLVGAPPLVIGIADTGAALGAAFAATAAGLATRDEDLVILASLGGATAGAVTGAIVGEKWHRSGTRRDIAAIRPPAWPQGVSVALGPLVPEGGGGGAQVIVEGW